MTNGSWLMLDQIYYYDYLYYYISYFLVEFIMSLQMILIIKELEVLVSGQDIGGIIGTPTVYHTNKSADPTINNTTTTNTTNAAPKPALPANDDNAAFSSSLQPQAQPTSSRATERAASVAHESANKTVIPAFPAMAVAGDEFLIKTLYSIPICM